MRVDHVVTYLEMMSPEQLRPGKHARGVVLEEVADDAEELAETRARVGAPYRWSAAEWSRRRCHPEARHWLIRVDGDMAGMLTLYSDPGGEVEIDTFGLTPKYVGRGYGGHALTLAIRQAWELSPADSPAVCRVWLHTSSTDHEHARPNYERRGFRCFASEARASKPD